ncbi:MAG: hypothetical protein CVU61_14325 [Deltaproteobacteria bacterium HGW-Deltaproteobacteria-19]|nr:MAG: hypothetical protein CVU61_14325 [Deltaproteobacteria bacterium HGW-Deltaproteobacteria-19]
MPAIPEKIIVISDCNCGFGLDGTRLKEPNPFCCKPDSFVHPHCIAGLRIEFTNGQPAFNPVKWYCQASAEVCTQDGCKTWPPSIARTVL